eukprot:scaffold43634_cov64-Phaeocystis_antarctica.AAC.10
MGPRCAFANTTEGCAARVGVGVGGQKARLPSSCPTPTRAPSTLTVRAVSAEVNVSSWHTDTRLSCTPFAPVPRRVAAGTHVCSSCSES